MTAVVLSICETVTAGPLASNHVRRVGPEGLRPGGGIPGLALCGHVVARGWDLRAVDVAEIWRLSQSINDAGRPWVCRRCADKAVAWFTDDRGQVSAACMVSDPPQQGHRWLAFTGETGQGLADAEFIAALDPHAVAALVPVLRLAAQTAERRPARALTEAERALVDLASAFARRVLREEETGD